MNLAMPLFCVIEVILGRILGRKNHKNSIYRVVAAAKGMPAWHAIKINYGGLHSVQREDSGRQVKITILIVSYSYQLIGQKQGEY
jgi:hypothetical protein